jgi:Zn-dependent M28 family amino/carboxypeptidase
MIEQLMQYCALDYEDRKAFILDKLKSLKVNVYLQDVGGHTNIFARYKGDHSTESMAFSAHYDKTDEGDGALDNGAAVIEILFVLESLIESGFENPFGFIFFDAEEIGLVGSKAYAEDPQFRVSGVYNFDVTGRGDSVLIGGDSYDSERKEFVMNSQNLNARVRQACDYHKIPVFYSQTPGCDNVSLNLAGIESTVVSTVPFDLGEYWQSQIEPNEIVDANLHINGVEDIVGKIEVSTLEMMKKLLLTIVHQTY